MQNTQQKPKYCYTRISGPFGPKFWPLQGACSLRLQNCLLRSQCDDTQTNEAKKCLCVVTKVGHMDRHTHIAFYIYKFYFCFCLYKKYLYKIYRLQFIGQSHLLSWRQIHLLDTLAHQGRDGDGVGEVHGLTEQGGEGEHNVGGDGITTWTRLTCRKRVPSL